MDIKTISEVRANAHTKWREYRAAEKATKGNEPLYIDLKKMYWQIKHGKVLIDIEQVIKAGGVHLKNDYSRLPKLAIARADQKKVTCQAYTDGRVLFTHRELTSRFDVLLPKGSFPTFTWTDNQNWRSKEGTAPVPMIPPKCLPKILTEDHFILWEVDEWKMIPPTDPYLLRRISKTIFAVEAQWDLTPLEKAAMAGRMH